MTNEPKMAPEAPVGDKSDQAAKIATDTKPSIAITPAPEKATVDVKKS